MTVVESSPEGISSHLHRSKEFLAMPLKSSASANFSRSQVVSSSKNITPASRSMQSKSKQLLWVRYLLRTALKSRGSYLPCIIVKSKIIALKPTQNLKCEF